MDNTQGHRCLSSEEKNRRRRLTQIKRRAHQQLERLQRAKIADGENINRNGMSLNQGTFEFGESSSTIQGHRCLSPEEKIRRRRLNRIKRRACQQLERLQRAKIADGENINKNGIEVTSFDRVRFDNTTLTNAMWGVYNQFRVVSDAFFMAIGETSHGITPNVGTSLSQSIYEFGESSRTIQADDVTLTNGVQLMLDNSLQNYEGTSIGSFHAGKVKDSTFATAPCEDHKKIESNSNTFSIAYESIASHSTRYLAPPRSCGYYESIVSHSTRYLAPPRSCSYCGARLFAYDCTAFCCSKGEIKLAAPNTPPEMLWLFTSMDREPQHFRKYIRGYNSAFSFTSFLVKPKQNVEPSEEIFCFKLQGKVYHRIDHLHPEDQEPKFLQLYIYDTDNELSNRLRHMPENLHPDIMAYITGILDRYNPLLRFLRSLKDMPNFEEYSISINRDMEVDQRVYSSPTTSQVAAIWVDGNNLHGTQQGVVLHPRQGRCCYISTNRGCYDPLQYPLLFPRAEPGWQHDVQRSTNGVSQTQRRVSTREYYAYKLQIRDIDTSILLYAGRLLHQYIVDMYVKIETERLKYLYLKQDAIKAELYNGLGDSIIEGHTHGSAVGRKILPASFIGGVRDVQARYRDAMAIVQNYGKPDLFITMTCNPNWPELQNQLYNGQQAKDRPDLCTRIFYSKLRDLMHVLFHEQALGKVIAYFIVVEFQKRGLPHAHMLLILDHQHKPRNPEDYDKLVSAEIPDSMDKELYDRVTMHMMHGPCGPGIKSPCMDNGLCRSHYPRAFCPSTTHGRDSYPIYRRRDDGKTIEKYPKQGNGNATHKKPILLDNRWVVPYNPGLLLMFDCHLNVEICSSVLSVKYLYKYVNNGHDCVQFSITPNGIYEINEIQRYQSARWISSVEAAWRIFGYELFFMSPAVYHLPVHLPNQHQVHYKAHENIVSMMEKETSQRTMLTEFFNMNDSGQVSLELLYREFPRYYVWQKSEKYWKRRKRDIVIGRTYAVSPKEGERYYLRLLLNHVKNPRSFEDLKTVDGMLCSTFREACIHRGLLDDDLSTFQCLLDAEAYQMPSSLRELFTTILVFCESVNIKQLWNRFWRSMAEDYTRQETILEEILHAMVLQDIDVRLRQNKKKVSDYDFPEASMHIGPFTSVPPTILGEVNVQTPSDDLFCITNLNNEQRNAYKIIVRAINEERGVVFFLDGPGGTGKTFLYRALLAYVRIIREEIAIATASSGIAAVNMPGGQTAHSRFDIPLKLDEGSTCNISKQSDLATLFRMTKLFIWDEASMMTRYAFEALNRSFQDIMGTNELFGGKIFVLGGDFRQILPIIPRGTRGQIVDSCLVSSFLWPLIRKLKLTQNMRAMADPDYASFVLRVGDGKEPTIGNDLIRIPDALLVANNSTCDGKITLIDEIFGGIEHWGTKIEWITERAILASTNDQVNEINQDILARFPGEEIVYYSYDSVEDDIHNLYSEEFLHKLNPNGFPLHELKLKKGCTIMLLRNLNPVMGLCNGTRLVCKGFDRHIIHAEIISGQHSGKPTFIPRIPMLSSDDAHIPILFKRMQFPIKLAFAMTINKSQGQTIPYTGVYLPDPLFTHG